MKSRVFALWAVVLMLAACGGGSSESDSAGSGQSAAPASSAQSSAVTLADAGEARAAAAIKGSQSIEWGDTGTVGDISYTASNPTVDVNEYDESALTIELKVENRSADEITYLEVGIVCSSDDEVGGWVTGSTLDLNAGIPAGTVDEGSVVLSRPGDARTGESVPECVDPAFVKITPFGPSGAGGSAALMIDPALVAELNV